MEVEDVSCGRNGKQVTAKERSLKLGGDTEREKREILALQDKRGKGKAWAFSPERACWVFHPEDFYLRAKGRISRE